MTPFLPILQTTGSAVAFSPPDIAGLTVWLRADDIPGADGDVVPSWPDVSGNGNDVPTVSGTPRLRLAAVNGHAAVEYSSASLDLMIRPTFTGGAEPAPNTLIIVRRDVANALQVYVDGGTGTDRQFLAGLVTGVVRVGFAPGTLLGDTNAPTNTPGAWCSHVGIASAPTPVVRLNGAGVTVVTGATSNPMNGITLGRDLTGGVPYYNGRIAEVLVYNSALSLSDVATVESYLRAKYALP